MIDMIEIPSGTFMMGAALDDPNAYEYEQPQHLVTIPSFCMSRTTVTEAQWNYVANLPLQNQILDLSPSKNGDNYPVTNVTWNDCIEFCDRLSLLTGKKYRLPSEAEWEYACRAGTTTQYFFGDTITENQANFSLMGKENKLMPVDQFPPNAFGLYDMHGNVWEWCQDNWHSNYDGAPTDGSAWLGNSEYHVLRGGSWCAYLGYCCSAYRSTDGYLSGNIGFRVVCSSI